MVEISPGLAVVTYSYHISRVMYVGQSAQSALAVSAGDYNKLLCLSRGGLDGPVGQVLARPLLARFRGNPLLISKGSSCKRFAYVFLAGKNYGFVRSVRLYTLFGETDCSSYNSTPPLISFFSNEFLW